VLGPVPVHDGVRIVDPEPESNRLDVLELAGQEEPFRARAGLSCIVVQDLRSVSLGVESQRQKAHIAGEIRLERLLNLNQVLDRSRSYAVTLRVDEVDEDEVPFDQILVEAMADSLVIDEPYVGKPGSDPLGEIVPGR
jgi:hypothetical protein